jgi:hypothetical protein
MQIPPVQFDILTAAITVGVLIQAGVLIGMYIAVRKAVKEASELSAQVKQHVLPVVTVARGLVEDISPKLKVATANLVEVSTTLRTQTEHLNKAVRDVTGMAQAQAVRVDEMATAVLDGVTNATAAVQHSVATPLKQVVGVLNAVRAGVEALRKKDRPTHVEHDGGNFV